MQAVEKSNHELCFLIHIFPHHYSVILQQMNLQFHNLTVKNTFLEAKLSNVDKQKKGLMGFEPPLGTNLSITRRS
jgi:hypothetical protein